MRKLSLASASLFVLAALSVETSLAQVQSEALRLDPCPEELFYAVALEVPDGHAVASVRWTASASPAQVWVVNSESVDEIDASRLRDAPDLLVTRSGLECSVQCDTPVGGGTSQTFVVMKYLGRGDGCHGGIMFELSVAEDPAYVGAPGSWYKLANSLAPELSRDVVPVQGSSATTVLGRTADANSVILGGDDSPADKPVSVSIQPNPFNPKTEIRFLQSQPGSISVRVYSLRGTLVWEKELSGLVAGHHTVEWHGTDSAGLAVASGVYLVQVRLPTAVLNKRAVLLK